MADHSGYKSLLHRTPGLYHEVGAWDTRFECSRCGLKLVEANGKYMKESEYMKRLRSRGQTVRHGWGVEKFDEVNCDEVVIKSVLEV